MPFSHGVSSRSTRLVPLAISASLNVSMVKEN
jgi:hypothetical protein